ncbi:MAG: glycosyl hydrolase [Flavobacteriales bacterium]|nr:glycosyl hydrolase [Flavobacteriales bacterium]
MRTKTNIIILAMIGLSLFGCAEKSPQSNIIRTTDRLKEVLFCASKENKVLFGQHDATLYGHTWKGERGRSDIKDVCGDYPAVIGFDLGGIEKKDSLSLDSVSFENIHQAIIDQYLRGGIVSISWHLDNPETGGNSWDVSSDSTVHSVLKGGKNYEKFTSWLENLSAFLLSLKAPDSTPIPIIFRPWHEHTGSWFWWGQDHCSADDYISLWRMTKEFLDSKGLANIVYAYSPNLGVTAQTYLERYPGDDIIDIFGMDIYQFDGEKGASVYMEETKKALSFLTEIGAKHNKIIAFTETGCESVPMEKWWTEVLLPSIKDYHISYVLVWRNAPDRPKHFYGPFPMCLCEEDFKTFYSMDKTVFANDIKYIHK